MPSSVFATRVPIGFIEGLRNRLFSCHIAWFYIRNFKPARWPAGSAQKYDKAVYSDDGDLLESRLGSPHGGYHDIDASPTLAYLIDHQVDLDIQRFLNLAVARREAEELYDIQRDPGCLNNLAGQSEFAEVQQQLAAQLHAYLRKTGDTRVTGHGDVWESYPRVSKLRRFPPPDWVTGSTGVLPSQKWLDARRPANYKLIADQKTE